MHLVFIDADGVKYRRSVAIDLRAVIRVIDRMEAEWGCDEIAIYGKSYPCKSSYAPAILAISRKKRTRKP